MSYWTRKWLATAWVAVLLTPLILAAVDFIQDILDANVHPSLWSFLGACVAVFLSTAAITVTLATVVWLTRWSFRTLLE